MAAGAVALAAPSLALASGAPRRFELVRDGSVIGSHSLAVQERGDSLIMNIRIDIAVRVLGIRVYAYEHENREEWRGGRLITLDSRTNDDGDEGFVRVRAAGDALAIEASGYSGPAPAEAAPTSYWNYGTFERRPWFSSQSGEIMDLAFDRSNAAGETVWRLSGDFATTLYYDAQKEWRGCSFDARGAEVTYRQLEPGPRFNTLI